MAAADGTLDVTPKYKVATQYTLDYPDKERVLFRALNDSWKFSDYLKYYTLCIVTAGGGLLISPLYDFHMRKKRISKLRIGNITAELDASLLDYFWDVYAHNAIYGVVTLGGYHLFGYAKQHENKWMDQKMMYHLVKSKAKIVSKL